MDPRLRLQRVRDHADFEQVDFGQLAATRRLAKAARAVPEAQPAHRVRSQQPGGAALRLVDPGDDPQSARILCRGFDPADALVAAVLPIERVGGITFLEGARERTAADRVCLLYTSDAADE